MADQNQAAQRESEARLILAELVMLDDRRCLTTLPHPTADSQADNDDISGLSDIIERARKWISVEPGTMNGGDTSNGNVGGWQPKHPKSAGRCPFADPTFSMDPREPCPVCGDLGTFDTEDAVSKCVGG